MTDVDLEIAEEDLELVKVAEAFEETAADFDIDVIDLEPGKAREFVVGLTLRDCDLVKVPSLFGPASSFLATVAPLSRPNLEAAELAVLANAAIEEVFFLIAFVPFSLFDSATRVFPAADFWVPDAALSIAGFRVPFAVLSLTDVDLIIPGFLGPFTSFCVSDFLMSLSPFSLEPRDSTPGFLDFNDFAISFGSAFEWFLIPGPVFFGSRSFVRAAASSDDLVLVRPRNAEMALILDSMVFGRTKFDLVGICLMRFLFLPAFSSCCLSCVFLVGRAFAWKQGRK